MAWGKIIGGILGLLLIKNIIGLLVGIWIGHQFDKGMRGQFKRVPDDGLTMQQRFFKATFTVMGYIAKLDGTVTRHEIEIAEAVMAHLQLTGEKRKEAIGFFNEGKSASEEQIHDLVLGLKQGGIGQIQLILLFVQIQIQVAAADGEIDKQEDQFLENMCRWLGINRRIYRELVNRVVAEQAFHKGRASGGNARANDPSALNQAYVILGVKESASDKEVKHAYRKLMSENHPDKLMAKGLPEEMLQIAKEKTQEIQAAYELVKSKRPNLR